MPGYSVTLDTRLLDKKLQKLASPVLGKVVVRTLNDLAFRGRKAVQDTMPRVFDRPTPQTIRSVRSDFAKLQNPVASVYISDDPNKGTPPSTYLQAQARGGQRRQKASERRMERIGILGRGEGWAPAKAMRLNRYGNVPGPRMVQILSQLKAFTEAGFSANVTRASRARKPGRKQYFVPRPGSSLPRGVYERHGRGQRKVRPVLMFVKLPRYRRRFDITGIVRKEAGRRIEQAFSRALGFEMARAGLKNT